MIRRPSTWFMIHHNQGVVVELRVARYSEHHVWFEGCECPKEISSYGRKEFFSTFEEAKNHMINEQKKSIEDARASQARSLKRIEQIKLLTGPERQFLPYGLPKTAWVKP